MRFMQIESVLQTINRSEPAKNRFSVALQKTCMRDIVINFESIFMVSSYKNFKNVLYCWE